MKKIPLSFSEMKVNREHIWSITVISGFIQYAAVHRQARVKGVLCVCWMFSHPSLCYYARGYLSCSTRLESTPRENMTPCGSYLFRGGSLRSTWGEKKRKRHIHVLPDLFLDQLCESGRFIVLAVLLLIRRVSSGFCGCEEWCMS